MVYPRAGQQKRRTRKRIGLSTGVDRPVDSLKKKDLWWM
jgi:hypothetical protein